MPVLFLSIKMVLNNKLSFYAYYRFVILLGGDAVCVISTLLFAGLVANYIVFDSMEYHDNAQWLFVIYLAIIITFISLGLLASLIYERLYSRQSSCYLVSVFMKVLDGASKRYLSLPSRITSSCEDLNESQILYSMFISAFILTSISPIILVDIVTRIVCMHVRNRYIQSTLEFDNIRNWAS